MNQNFNRNKKYKQFYLSSLLVFSALFQINNQALAQAQENISSPSAVSGTATEIKIPAKQEGLEEKVKSFSEKSIRLQLLFISSSTKILSNYSDQDERARWLEQLKLIKEAIGADEQADLAKRLNPLLANELQKLINSPDFAERTKALSQESRKELIDLIPSFIIITIQTKNIIDQGNEILKYSAEAPLDQLPKLLQIKSTFPGLVSTTSLLSKVIPKILAISKMQ